MRPALSLAGVDADGTGVVSLVVIGGIIKNNILNAWYCSNAASTFVRINQGGSCAWIPLIFFYDTRKSNAHVVKCMGKYKLVKCARLNSAREKLANYFVPPSREDGNYYYDRILENNIWKKGEIY